MKRYPEGVDQEYFFEKNAPMHRPDWVKTAPVWSGSNRRTIHFILANDLPTLVWIANLASIELHPSLSLATDIATPTMIVFDLDPGPPANIVQCAQVGLWVREIFDHFGLQSFPKTSGSKGLQVYVPLNTKTSYQQTKSFAHAIARLLEQEHPELVVSDMKKAVRTNKVLVDWSQNDEHKTTISVYSLRARERPTVSTPVSWREVEQALKQKNAGGLVFESNEVLARVEKMGDLFAPVQKLKQKLPQLAGLDGGSGGNGEQEGDADQEEAGVSLAAEGQTGRRANPKKRATTKGDSASEKRRKL
jgi:bifunctional non-homologous end joining protein LigD